MKTDLKAKLLQHLIDQHKDEGFTLIELLVVIIVIGILAAIALPSYLNQVNKARESEARAFVGAMNRAQQAYYLVHDSFAADLTILQLAVPASSQYYSYSTTVSAGDAESRAARVAGSRVAEFSGVVWEQSGLTYGRFCKGVTPSRTCSQ
ncbi:type IV pilin protein [Leptolyngbya ohadii]|uniref:type IV pilin protein n=1 Tax=Leptolyngbya ohadii TaxID=1962290 RepID=UPI000B59BE8F|nr:type IV pilin-like G/H family protein [Leptolyngbya ohadii]